MEVSTTECEFNLTFSKLRYTQLYRLEIGKANFCSPNKAKAIETNN